LSKTSETFAVPILHRFLNSQVCLSKPYLIRSQSVIVVSSLVGLVKKVSSEATTSSSGSVLTKPSSYLKGTKMSYAGLRKEKDRASIIKYLNQNSDSPKLLP
jgi:hypothetical protein